MIRIAIDESKLTGKAKEKLHFIYIYIYKYKSLRAIFIVRSYFKTVLNNILRRDVKAIIVIFLPYL